ncbi:MAG: hypothetical protein WBG30_06340 [Psychrilyobacter sp.]|uniref:hypothetical protein n=1 Tax=Psychrilyobacter sp. TaxID=2586924 RepID=UPI003C72D733
MKKTIIFFMAISLFTLTNAENIEQKGKMFKKISDLETRILRLERELKDIDFKLVETKEYNFGIRDGIEILKINDEVIQSENLKLKRNINDIKNYYSIKAYMKK